VQNAAHETALSVFGQVGYFGSSIELAPVVTEETLAAAAHAQRVANQIAALEEEHGVEVL
jgi:hypothetical protein